MISIIEWLLDLDHIRLAKDAPLLLKWHAEAHAWVLSCAAILFISLIVLVYRRERMSSSRRAVLAAVRILVVALVVAVLCEPAIVLQRNRVEPSHVALLLDTSLSMSQTDAYRDPDFAARLVAGAGANGAIQLGETSRLALVSEALRREAAAPLEQLLSRNAVQLVTFSDIAEVHQLVHRGGAVGSLVEALENMDAAGPGTDVAGAIESVIDKARGRRLAGIILASDGRSTQSSDWQYAIDLANGRRIPIYALRIGSPFARRNILVGSVRAQDAVFVNDVLAVEAELRAEGVAEAVDVIVRLEDEATGEVLAEEVVAFAAEGDGTTQTVELMTKPRSRGLKRYRVVATPLEDETIVEDNTGRVDVVVLDNQLRILYVDAYPRYEYRYLKNALLRESTAELSVLLLGADERFVQEGTEPIRRFPETPEELNRYDVVLFGDVDPRSGWLTDAQMIMLLDFVGNRGGGFGLIAGDRASPNQFLGTPLEKLVAVRIDPEFSGRYEQSSLRGFQPALTPEGRRSRLFRFAADREDSAELFAGLPDLYWMARTLGPKPGTSVLVEHPSMRAGEGRMPLVVTGRYGAGKIFFQATDDTWRWRRHTGEWIHDSYWVQVARWLMPGARVAQDRQFVIRTDKRVYRYGDAVRVQVAVSDTRLLAPLGESIELTMQPASGGSAPQSRAPLGDVRRLRAHRIGHEANVFEVAYVPPRPGDYVVAAPSLVTQGQGRTVAAGVRVEPPNLESRRPQADHESLERLAQATGGRMIELDELVAGFDELKDRSVLIPDDLVEPLWDSKLVLVLFAILLSTEWVLRKMWGAL